MRATRTWRAHAIATAVAGCAAAMLAGCDAGSASDRSVPPADVTDSAATSVPVIRLPSASPTPASPPSGRLFGDLRQSSRDAALGRMQVWITNDTASDVSPRRISFADSRLGASVAGERLRDIPAGSYRGYPLTYPVDLPCSATRTAGERRTVEVELAGEADVRTFRVADPNGLVGAYVDRRCAEIAVERVADLSWSPDVEVQPGGTALMTLVLTPTGGRGQLSIRQVHGTPLLTPADGDVWRPEVEVRGTEGRPVTAALAVRPSRCDPHVFMESTGATAFAVDYRLDGEPGSIVLRMGDEAARNVLAYAVDVCGLG